MSEWIKRLVGSTRSKSRLENLCRVCGTNQLSENPTTLRLKVQEGTAEMKVCDDCANFFDKSAEVLGKRRPRIAKDSSDEQPV